MNPTRFLSVFSLCVFACAAEAVAAPQIHPSCTISQPLGSTTSGSAAPDWTGQSFTACSRGQVTSIEVRKTRVGDLTVVLALQEGFGVATPTYSETVTLSGATSRVVLSRPFPVDAGREYSFAMRATSGPLELQCEPGDPYAGGELFFMSNGLVTRPPRSPDLQFEVQIDPIPAGECTISQPTSDGQSGAFAPNGLGQSFVPCGSGDVRWIEVRVTSSNDPNAVLKLGPGFGVGAATHTQNVSLTPGVNRIELSTPFPVRSGVEYSFALFPATGLLALREQNADPYAGGEFFYMSSSGPTRSSSHPDFEFALAIDRSDALCTFRNGTGVNATGYACTSEPAIGSVWTSSIATVASTSSTFILLSNAPAQTSYLGSEVLVDAPLALMSLTGSHAIPIPYESPLVGLELFTQGARLDQASGSAGLVLLNAQDLTIGF